MRSRVALLGVLAAVGLVVTTAGPAAAQQWNYDPPPWTSTITRDTPVYPESPDSWGCHFWGSCRPDTSREDADPAPIAILGRGETVEFYCEFGAYAEVVTEDGSLGGWVPREDVGLPYRVPAEICGLGQWRGWWN